MARNGGVRGDYRKLAKLITAAAQAAEKRLLRSAARRMGDATLRLATDGAAAGNAPSGRQWKPKKSGGAPLTRVAGTLRLRAYDGAFVVSSSRIHLAFHNKGAKRRGTNWRLPKRTILPKKSLPKKWRPAIERAGMSAFRLMLGRRI